MIISKKMSAAPYPRLSSMSAIRFLLSRFCLSPFVLAINCQIGSIFSCSLH